MRQVFSSTRLENVEGVAKLLGDAGIEVRITGGRSYKSGWGGRRTYNDSQRAAEPAAVWVVKSEDQPRARQLLRDTGLLESTSLRSESYLGPSLHQRPERTDVPTPQRRALRAKIWLLLGIGIVIALVFNVMRRQPAPEAPVATPAVPTAPVDATPTPSAPVVQPIAPPSEAHTIATPPALAATLLAAELRAQQVREACVSVDGAALPASELAALESPSTVLHNPDACAGEDGIPLAFDVSAWTTDGSGTGTVELATTRRGADGTPATEARELTVAREGVEWRVLDSGVLR